MRMQDRYDSLIRHYAEGWDLNWRRIKRQIEAESSFDPLAESPAGAVGLMQFMPETWAEWSPHPDAPRTNPEWSIAAGCAYMAHLYGCYREIPDELERYCCALAAFNAGRGSVNQCLEEARRMWGAPASYAEWDASGRPPGPWQTWAYASKCLSLVTGTHASETIAYVTRIMGPERSAIDL